MKKLIQVCVVSILLFLFLLISGCAVYEPAPPVVVGPPVVIGPPAVIVGPPVIIRPYYRPYYYYYGPRHWR